MSKHIRFIYFFFGLLVLFSCKKLVQIPPPVSSITTTEVFADSSDANAAIIGIYTQMINGSESYPAFANGLLTFSGGESADELNPYYSGGDQFYPNALTSINGNIDGSIWIPAYSYIHQANACIEGIEASTGLTQAQKNEFLGEAKFLRALCYFYLTGYFGDVPYVTSAEDWASNTLLARTPQAQVYQAIISDLEEVIAELPADYSMAQGEHTRANKWAALALLAKTYLFAGNFGGADSASNAVISSGDFQLVAPNNVFLANSGESILQWELDEKFSYVYNATLEGYSELPSYGGPPSYSLDSMLIRAFEPGDLRFTDWVDSENVSGIVYYYPYKYKQGSQGSSPSTAPPEYYMVLRLGEQYLIRAEAEAHGIGGGASAAITDLNTIRSRALLPALPSTLSSVDLMNAVAHERQIELFAEWGNRWLDLRRTGAVDSVMTRVSPLKTGLANSWISSQQLYPIPLSDMNTDPNLTQNQGY